MTTAQPSQAPRRLFGRDRPFPETPLEQQTKLGVVFEELVNQIVLLFKRRQLKCRHPVHGHDDRFIMAHSARSG
jgi:hypothetical protein